MKKFEDGLKQKAHIFKIKQAKTTILSSTKHQSKYIPNKVGAEANLLLQLYQQKQYDSIPAYKLLRTAGLQQYTRGFIQRGYGINLGRLALISQDSKRQLYEQLKILPGHTTKLDKIIDSLAKNSYLPSSSSSPNQNIYSRQGIEEMPSIKQQKTKLKVLAKKDYDYQKQLQRVLNEYTPQSSTSEQKKKIFNITKSSQKKYPQPPSSGSSNKNISTETKYTKTKYSANVKDRSADFKKKVAQVSTIPTMKKTSNENKRQSLAFSSKLKKIDEKNPSMSTKQVMQMDLQINKVKSLNRSFDGALMTSTIANIDTQELIYAFSGFIAFQVVVAQEKQIFYKKQSQESLTFQQQQNQQDYIEDQVGQILKESFLHPLYKQQAEVQEQLVCDEDAYSQGEQEEQQPYDKSKEKPSQISHQISREQTLLQQNNRMMQSSFLSGGQSVDFEIAHPLLIFDEPQPTAIDYFKPTIDSVSNFIKNIVLTAKMEREIPIMAATYLQNFIEKTKLTLTSLNYKRLLVSTLLLASKIWDDQSFQTPSFSKTFPQYSTVLLNEMQKQIVKALNYKLKIDKKQYTKIYFKMRKYTKENIKSYQNRKLSLKRIRELQVGIKKDYKSNFMTKRNSY